MSQTLPKDAAYLDVDSGATGGVDFTIPGRDLATVAASFRAGRPTDEGDITIQNDDWEYTTGDQQVSIGDRLLFVAQPPTDPADETETAGFGGDAFGTGPFGDYRRVGTLQVLDWDIVEHPPDGADLTVKVADWVWSTLGQRVVFYRGRDVPISGSSEAVLNTVLRENAPAVDRSSLPTIDATVDYFTAGKELDKVVSELAAYATEAVGPVLLGSYGQQLMFQPIDSISPVTDDPLPPGQFGPWSTSSESHELTNWVRLTGGVDDVGNVDDEQTTVDHFETVTDTSRLTHRLATRKSELTKIELYTKGHDDNNDGVRVRLQVSNDANDGPIAPADYDSDIVSSGVKHYDTDAGSEEGWFSFSFGEHDIPERNPWLIIDSDGSGGHDVGVDADDVPAYKALFPKPVAAQLRDQGSIDAYGRREAHIKNETLATSVGVRDRARAVLNDSSSPPVTIGPVETRRYPAHDLRVGERVTFDRPEMRATGDFLVTKRDVTFEGTSLTTSLTFQGADSYGG